MSELPNQEIEGRLIAQRQVLAHLIAHITRLERNGALLETLNGEAELQDYQEDPGAVPSGAAFAIEGAIMRELELIIREARSYLDTQAK